MAVWLVLVSLLSMVSIPIGPVPVTLQVFAIFLMAFFLSPIDSLMVIIGYIVLGILGLPIFAGRGGIGVLLGPTGGYVFGFVPAAFIASYGWRCIRIFRFLTLSAALFVIYLFGVLWLYFYLKDFAKAVEVGVLPFVWIDMIKISLVFPFAKRVQKNLPRKIRGGNDDS